MLSVKADEDSIKDNDGNPVAGRTTKLAAVVNVVIQLRTEIKELWRDAVVRTVLKRRRVKLDSSAE